MNSSVRIALLSDFQLSREAFASAINHSASPQPISVEISTELDNLDPRQNHDVDVILIDVDQHATEALAWMERHERTNKPSPIALLGRRIDEYVIDQALMSGCKGIISEDKSIETFCRAIVAVARGEVWLQGKATHYLLHRLQHDHQHSPQGEYGEQLTKREMQIVTLFREHPDYSATGLAEKLNVSESTLRNHLTRVYRKLGVKNRSALLNKVMRGYLDMPPH